MLPLLLMTSLWVMTPHPTTHAASGVAECIRVGTVKEAVRRAPVVFVGDVMAIRILQDEGLTEVTFEVVEAFKGIKPGKQMLRFINLLDDYLFRQESVRVLVVAHRDGEHYSSGCSWTGVVAPHDPVLGEVRRSLMRRR